MAALTGAGANTADSNLSTLSVPGVGGSSAIGSNPALQGLGGISLAPLSAPASTLPSNVTPGGVVSQMQTSLGQSLGLTSVAPSYTTPNYSGSYTISSGDTLNSIAAKYGTTAAALAQANNIDNPNLIQAGASLKVPGEGTYSAPATPTVPSSTTTPMSSSYASSLAPTSSYNIDTSGALPSTALGSTDGTNGNTSPTNSSYAQAVQNLYQATQLPDSYTQALAAYQAAQLKASADAVNGQYQGDTTDFAQGITQRQEQTDALNTTAASNALAVEQAKYQANISANQGIVTANAPQSVSPGSSLVNPTDGSTVSGGLGSYQAVQAIGTVNGLASAYPDAGIQPTDTLQQAEAKASASPSFAAHQLVQVTLPGGGIEFINKNQLQTNPDGSYTVIGSSDAATQSAAASNIATLSAQQAQLTSQLTTVNTNFPLLTSIVQKYGLNTSVPLINQFTNMTDQQLGQSGITQLNAVVTGLKATMSQIINRGAPVTVNAQNEANNLLPENATLPVLQDLYNTIQQEGQGVLTGLNTSIAQQQALLGGGSGSGTSGSSNNYGSSFSSIMSSLSGS